MPGNLLAISQREDTNLNVRAEVTFSRWVDARSSDDAYSAGSVASLRAKTASSVPSHPRCSASTAIARRYVTPVATWGH